MQDGIAEARNVKPEVVSSLHYNQQINTLVEADLSFDVESLKMYRAYKSEHSNLDKFNRDLARSHVLAIRDAESAAAVNFTQTSVFSNGQSIINRSCENRKSLTYTKALVMRPFEGIWIYRPLCNTIPGNYYMNAMAAMRSAQNQAESQFYRVNRADKDLVYSSIASRIASLDVHYLSFAQEALCLILRNRYVIRGFLKSWPIVRATKGNPSKPIVKNKDDRPPETPEADLQSDQEFSHTDGQKKFGKPRKGYRPADWQMGLQVKDDLKDPGGGRCFIRFVCRDEFQDYATTIDDDKNDDNTYVSKSTTTNDLHIAISAILSGSHPEHAVLGSRVTLLLPLIDRHKLAMILRYKSLDDPGTRYIRAWPLETVLRPPGDTWKSFSHDSYIYSTDLQRCYRLLADRCCWYQSNDDINPIFKWENDTIIKQTAVISPWSVRVAAVLQILKHVNDDKVALPYWHIISQGINLDGVSLGYHLDNIAQITVGHPANLVHAKGQQNTILYDWEYLINYFLNMGYSTKGRDIGSLTCLGLNYKIYTEGHYELLAYENSKLVYADVMVFYGLNLGLKGKSVVHIEIKEDISTTIDKAAIRDKKRRGSIASESSARRSSITSESIKIAASTHAIAENYESDPGEIPNKVRGDFDLTDSVNNWYISTRADWYRCMPTWMQGTMSKTLTYPQYSLEDPDRLLLTKNSSDVVRSVVTLACASGEVVNLRTSGAQLAIKTSSKLDDYNTVLNPGLLYMTFVGSELIAKDHTFLSIRRADCLIRVETVDDSIVDPMVEGQSLLSHLR